MKIMWLKTEAKFQKESVYEELKPFQCTNHINGFSKIMSTSQLWCSWGEEATWVAIPVQDMWIMFDGYLKCFKGINGPKLNQILPKWSSN